MTKKRSLSIGLGIVLFLLLLGIALIFWGDPKDLSATGSEGSGGESTILPRPKQTLPEDTQTVGYEYGGYGLSLSLPAGWEYEIEEQDSEKWYYGIRIRPQGETEDLCVFYYTQFGVCGTGLTQQKSTLGEYEVNVGSYAYDDASLWDFIVVKNIEAEGDFAITRDGDLSWWNEKCDEAMLILGSLQLSYPVHPVLN